MTDEKLPRYLLEMKMDLIKISARITQSMEELISLLPNDNVPVLNTYLNFYTQRHLEFKQQILAINHNRAFIKNQQRIQNLVPKDDAPVEDVI